MTSKLDQLLACEGYDSLDHLLEAILFDSVSPGICINPGCHYTTRWNPTRIRAIVRYAARRRFRPHLFLQG